jgi:hypothetical protein
MLARWLRRTAKRAARADPLDRRREALPCDRVRSVSGQLLEIASLLERSTDPDPRPAAELHKLLKDGCESPLYNPDVHESELRATVHYLRSALATSEHGDRVRSVPVAHRNGMEAHDDACLEVGHVPRLPRVDCPE